MKVTVLLTIIAGLLAGCGTGAGDNSASSGASAKPILATSELLVGPNRFVFGLVNAKTSAPLADTPDTVDVQLLKVHDNDTATKVGDATAVYRAEGLPAGVFVTRTTFDQAGS